MIKGNLIVVNRHWQEPYNEYGGRGSVLGNYTGITDREAACDAYEKVFDEAVTSEEPNALQDKVLWLIEKVRTDGDYYIACSCKVKHNGHIYGRCHLDTVADYVNGILAIT